MHIILVFSFSIVIFLLYTAEHKKGETGVFV